MHPTKTYELRIEFTSPELDKNIDEQAKMERKTLVKEWLVANGVESFVEGVIDGLDIDHEFTGEVRDFYTELGGDCTPISVYKYSLESLVDLKAKLDHQFNTGVFTSMHSMDTQVWLEGWKDSFKPISTEQFYIYPPWDKTPHPPDKLPLVIEPGIAFGTGQHATTQAVIVHLEGVAKRLFSAKPPKKESFNLLDVGTGTGILAIAAHKLGFGPIVATDIDPDAVMAAKMNADMNIDLNATDGAAGAFTIADGSVPESQKNNAFDVVLANILTVVLEKILPDLAATTKIGGTLILSGILHEDGAEMAGRAKDLGLVLVKQTETQGWAGLEFRKER